MKKRKSGLFLTVLLAIGMLSGTALYVFAEEGGTTYYCAYTTGGTWTETTEPCPKHPATTVQTCYEGGSTEMCEEFCCSICHYPHVQPPE